LQSINLEKEDMTMPLGKKPDLDHMLAETVAFYELPFQTTTHADLP